MGKVVRCPECSKVYRDAEELEELRDNDSICMVCNAPIEVGDWDRILASWEEEEGDVDEIEEEGDDDWSDDAEESEGDEDFDDVEGDEDLGDDFEDDDIEEEEEEEGDDDEGGGGDEEDDEGY